MVSSQVAHARLTKYAKVNEDQTVPLTTGCGQLLEWTTGSSLQGIQVLGSTHETHDMNGTLTHVCRDGNREKDIYPVCCRTAPQTPALKVTDRKKKI